MDFIKVIRSLEELLYEVVTWLVFYPRTMWRVVAHPAAATEYAEDEQKDIASEQYTDTLSPPLLLMLTILIAHGIELGVGLPPPDAKSALGQAVWSSDQNLLSLRALLFSIFPLVGATTLLRRRHVPLDRNTLRRPFYSQCYIAAPFVFAFSVGMTLTRSAPPGAQEAGLTLLALAVFWYVAVETSWFQRQLAVGRGRAFVIAAGSFARTIFWGFLAALALGLLLR